MNLRDVGYGVSQVLPIVLQARAAPNDALIIVEQPELHLHNKAQAVMADMFISHAQEQGKLHDQPDQALFKAKRRFLIETHSEQILLRLKLRIAETVRRELEADGQSISGTKKQPVFEASNFGIAFVTRKEGRSEIEYVEANDIGRLEEETPEAFREFFSEDYLDSRDFSLAIARISKLETSAAQKYNLEVNNEAGD